MKFNHKPDTAQNYNLPFVAHIVDAQVAPSGPFEGLTVYSWVEQTYEAATGSETNAASPRSGRFSADAPDDAYQPAFEPNNYQIEPGALVLLQVKGFVGNLLTYRVVDAAPPTWVKVTGSASEGGWYPGVLQLWDSVLEEWWEPERWDAELGELVAGEVWVRPANAETLVSDTRYLVLYSGLRDRVQSYTATVGGSGGGSVAVPFLAQLTNLYSQNRWDFQPAQSIHSPAEGGHEVWGDEVTGGLAYGVAFSPLAPYASYNEVNNVQAGQVVLMWESARADGTYEFLPQQLHGVGSTGLVTPAYQTIAGPKLMPTLYIPSGYGSGPGGQMIQFAEDTGDPLTLDPWAKIRTTSPASEIPYATGIDLLATNQNLPDGWGVEPEMDKTFALGVDGDRGAYFVMPNEPGVPGAPPKWYSHDPYAAAGGNYHGVVSALSPYGIRLPTMLDGWGGSTANWFNEPAPNTIYAKTGSSGTCFYKDSMGTEHDLLGGPSEIDGGGP